MKIISSASKSKGHRKRLREKVISTGITGFNDYEIIELLLTLGTPLKDCKQPAKDALTRFKTLRGVLEASPEELQSIKGIGPHNYFGIKLISEVANKYLKEKIINKDAVKSSSDVYAYLLHSMGGLKTEIFKSIFLNAQNNILETEDTFHGSLTSSAIYPREIVKSALRHNAAGIIFAHNHPSGNPEASEDDKIITRQLVSAGNLMQIKVLDHIIIGGNSYYSFADHGLIQKYLDETDE